MAEDYNAADFRTIQPPPDAPLHPSTGPAVHVDDFDDAVAPADRDVDADEARLDEDSASEDDAEEAAGDAESDSEDVSDEDDTAEARADTETSQGFPYSTPGTSKDDQ